jgi:hypothetical protein
MADNDDLTLTERAVLLILMAEAREVPNADLTNIYRLKLPAEYRERLKERKLIAVRKEGTRFFLALHDLGGVWCKAEVGAPVPDRAGAGGAMAYALLANLVRQMTRKGIELTDVYERSSDDLSMALAKQPKPESPGKPKRPKAAKKVAASAQTAALTDDDIAVRVRDAYTELASQPGDSVPLADLRARLSGLSKSEVDRVLVLMNRTPEVSILPESNQMTLQPRDRDAVVIIGNQEKHLIKIGS